jgi:hypothetical protein
MANVIQDLIAPNSSEAGAHTLNTHEGSTERQEVDNWAAREYLPMDIFVDARTTSQHFQGSSIRDQWTGILAVIV